MIRPVNKSKVWSRDIELQRMPHPVEWSGLLGWGDDISVETWMNSWASHERAGEKGIKKEEMPEQAHPGEGETGVLKD